MFIICHDLTYELDGVDTVDLLCLRWISDLVRGLNH